MTTKNLLKGLEYRLKQLRKVYEVLITNEQEFSVTDCEARIDELESVIK